VTRLILASASPRRRELLAALVSDFDVVAADVDETLGDDARADAVRLAAAKAQVVAARFPGAVVVGSDTIVFDDERSFGKPADARDAVIMLGRLRGRTHRVVTAVAVAAGGPTATAASEAEVRLHNLDYGTIVRYVETGRPLDKAGSYAIQDEDVPTVQAIDGCYCCVVGLPLWRLRALLESAGVACHDPGATFPRCVSCPERTL